MLSIPLVFIAGPFRGPVAWDVAENVRWAERYGLEVAKLGAMPVIPQANSQHFYGQLSEEDFWLPGYQRLLDVCDAMVLIRRWEFSQGARAEKFRMHTLGRGDRVFDLSSFPPEYIAQNRDYERLKDWIAAFKAAPPAAAGRDVP